VLQSRFRYTRFNDNGHNRRKVMCHKTNETEEQLPKRDYKMALLTDMKSKIEII